MVGEELRYSVYQDGGFLLLEGGSDHLLLEDGSSLLLEDVRSKHPLAGEMIVPALFDEESDAQAEAIRLFQLHGVDRELVNLPVVNRITGLLNINDVVEVQLNRYNWDDGKRFGWWESARISTAKSRYCSCLGEPWRMHW